MDYSAQNISNKSSLFFFQFQFSFTERKLQLPWNMVRNNWKSSNDKWFWGVFIPPAKVLWTMLEKSTSQFVCTGSLNRYMMYEWSSTVITWSHSRFKGALLWMDPQDHYIVTSSWLSYKKLWNGHYLSIHKPVGKNFSNCIVDNNAWISQ